MGIHSASQRKLETLDHGDLAMVTFQLWSAMDRTMIAAIALYQTDEGPVSVNIGGHVLDYRVLSLPHLNQVVYTAGDEIKKCWRELSSPK